MNLQEVKYLLCEKTEFKNFKELCDHLGEDYNGQTNSKKSLEKKFRQFFEFEKVKGTNKIVVTEVFDSIKPNFKTKGSSLPEFLNPAILSIVEVGNAYAVSSIAKKLKLVSEDIIKFYTNSESEERVINTIYENENKDLTSDDGIKKSICGFINDIQSSYTSSIKSSLENLKKQGYISYTKGEMIHFPKDFSQTILKMIMSDEKVKLKESVFPWVYERIEQFFELKEYTNIDDFLLNELAQFDIFDDSTRRASPREELLIDEIRNELLKDFKYESEQKLMSDTIPKPGVRRSYFSQLGSKIKKKYNISTFKGYYITKKTLETSRDDKLLKPLNDEFCKLRIKLANRKESDKYDERLSKEKCPKLKAIYHRRIKASNLRRFDALVENFLRIS